MKALLGDYNRLVATPDRAIISLIAECLEKGMEPAVIKSAIRDTSRAPRPSKRYLAAILNRYLDEKVFWVTDLIRDKDRHEARIQSAKRRRYAKWYDDDSQLTGFDQAQANPFADPYDCDIDNFIPDRTAPDDIDRRLRQILGDDY